MKTVEELINSRDERLINEMVDKLNNYLGWGYDYPYNSWDSQKEKNKICDKICDKLNRHDFTKEEIIKAMNESDNESDFNDLFDIIHRDIDGDSEIITEQDLIERITSEVLSHISMNLSSNTNLCNTDFGADFYL